MSVGIVTEVREKTPEEKEKIVYKNTVLVYQYLCQKIFLSDS